MTTDWIDYPGSLFDSFIEGCKDLKAAPWTPDPLILTEAQAASIETYAASLKQDVEYLQLYFEHNNEAQ